MVGAFLTVGLRTLPVRVHFWMTDRPGVSPEVEALLEQAYRAFNRRDIDAVLALMHPDVTWPNGWEGGYIHGHEEVRAYWSRQWQALDPTVTPVEYRGELDGRIAIKVHQVAKDMKGALVADHYVYHHYRIEAGKIRSMEIGATSDS